MAPPVHSSNLYNYSELKCGIVNAIRRNAYKNAENYVNELVFNNVAYDAWTSVLEVLVTDISIVNPGLILEVYELFKYALKHENDRQTILNVVNALCQSPKNQIVASIMWAARNNSEFPLASKVMNKTRSKAKWADNIVGNGIDMKHVLNSFICLLDCATNSHGKDKGALDYELELVSLGSIVYYVEKYEGRKVAIKKNEDKDMKKPVIRLFEMMISTCNVENCISILKALRNIYLSGLGNPECTLYCAILLRARCNIVEYRENQITHVDIKPYFNSHKDRTFAVDSKDLDDRSPRLLKETLTSLKSEMVARKKKGLISESLKWREGEEFKSHGTILLMTDKRNKFLPYRGAKVADTQGIDLYATKICSNYERCDFKYSDWLKVFGRTIEDEESESKKQKRIKSYYKE
jgi:hypothetical protein